MPEIGGEENQITAARKDRQRRRLMGTGSAILRAFLTYTIAVETKRAWRMPLPWHGLLFRNLQIHHTAEQTVGVAMGA